MAKRSDRSNLGATVQIRRACRLDDLEGWFDEELSAVGEAAVRKVVRDVAANLDAFIRWPQRAVLLWPGCCRTIKYHCYPETIKREATVGGIRLDTRSNGPAIAAFLHAGGMRPPRWGSRNQWSIHHLYFGRFPYRGKPETVHAAKEGQHFTQSAGLVALHPIADGMCDEFACFAWLLRAEAFKRFGYDPDRVFDGGEHDEYGFVPPRTCEVVRVPAL